MDQKTRKRKRRACDPCRKSKSRCEDAGSGAEDDPCRNCLVSGNAGFVEPQSTEPVRKRGPPKGYMSALEQRLNNAEALLSAVIYSSDPRAISLIADLSMDSLACSTLGRIRDGEYGLGGRAKGHIRANSSGSQNNSGNSPPQLSSYTKDESLMSKLDSEFNEPSLEWRDSLGLRLALGTKNRESSLQASSSKVETSGNRSIQSRLKKDFEIAEKEEDELLSDSDDVLMREAEPVTISQTLRRELNNPPRSAGTSYYTSRGSQYKDRPVSLILLFGLGIEPDCWDLIYRPII